MVGWILSLVENLVTRLRLGVSCSCSQLFCSGIATGRVWCRDGVADGVVALVVLWYWLVIGVLAYRSDGVLSLLLQGFDELSLPVLRLLLSALRPRVEATIAVVTPQGLGAVLSRVIVSTTERTVQLVVRRLVVSLMVVLIVSSSLVVVRLSGVPVA